MPKVSVVIPSFNHEKYIREAIESVLNQTFQDFEIIITDDGSSDNTVEEIKKFKDNRIKLFCFAKNRGAPVASTNCLNHAKGTYIAPLNSDDAFQPTKLEKQVVFLDENPRHAAVFSYAKIVDETGGDFTDEKHFYYSIFKQPNRTRYEWLHFFFHNGNALCYPSSLVRRRAIDTVGGYDKRLAQLIDLDQWVRFCMRWEIHLIQENLVRFRIRDKEKNISANKPITMVRHAWELYQILHHYLHISSLEELLLIFPEMKKYINMQKELIPYYVSRLALERKWAPYQLFGINVLFALLNDPANAQLLEKNHGFTYADFITLTGESDIMNFYELFSRDAQIQKLKDSLLQYNVTL